MATRLIRVVVFLLALSVFVAPAGVMSAQTPTIAAIVEPPAPMPSAAVEKLLNEASRLAEAKQPVDSLKVAEDALDAARDAKDRPGEAFSHQSRAKALQSLQRTDDAVAAWQQAAQIWADHGDTPEQITALVQAGSLCGSDRKKEADRFFAQGLTIGKLQGQRPIAVAKALHDSGIFLNRQGQQQAAWDFLSAALTIREKQAPGSLQLVETLNAVADSAYTRGEKNTDAHDISLARDYFAQAVDLSQRLAPDSYILMESLNGLALSEDYLDSYDSAHEHYLAALRIQKAIVPGGSMRQLRILLGLGDMECRHTNFDAAQQHSEEAVAIGERLDPASKWFAQALENLALVESEEGDLLSARDHLQRALGIEQKLHANTANMFINLGVVALSQYDLASARKYFENALSLFMEHNPNGAGVAYSLGNLSETFYRQGDLASALEYGRRALVIDEEKLGATEDTAEDLSGMGDILRALGRFSAAADYYHRALDVREKIAPESLRVSDSLFALAGLARAQQNKTLAMEYDNRALELGQRSCPNSWCVVRILHDLGELAYEQGDLVGSERYLRQAVDIREKGLGATHPDLARSLNSLALTIAALGRPDDALEMALRAERIGAEHLRASIVTLSERQALAYEDVRASGLDLALTLAADRTVPPSARSQVFDAVVHSRALVFDELAERHRSAYGSGDPEVKQLADQLFSARAQLATLVFRGAGDNKPEAYRNMLDEARDHKEKAERMLADKSIAFRQEQARTHLGLKEVAASLPPDTAVVGFIRYARYDFKKPPTDKTPSKPVPSYAAIVLRAGQQEPAFVLLDGANKIESLVAAWRQNISQQAEVTDAPANGGEEAYRRSGAALRRKIWDPLVPLLGNSKEVFIVPDAALHLVNLASLPIGNSHYLVETGPLIHYLSTERDIVPRQYNHGDGILVLGNPAFDKAGKLIVTSTKQSAPANATTGRSEALLRGSRSSCGTFQNIRFAPLPASQQEAENIASLWKRSTSRPSTGGQMSATQPSGQLLQLIGAEASPEAFEQYAPGKRVLHIATHGFFLEGKCNSAADRQFDANQRDVSLSSAAAESPLLLSGLAFAGANRRASATLDETDGILTAEEIAGMNLQGVDWAVLSACDTGVGEIKVGEGVFGLRRAFQVAGAKTVIMSLWRVEDETTRQWMGTLYREHFIEGMETGQSVRAASLLLLKQRRVKHQSTHPFYWGAFIAAGDWR